jgi:hypothetical protein
MRYKVFEVHEVYEDGKLTEIAVLWESNAEYGWVRSSYCTATPCGGYKFLLPKDQVSPELIQQVAGYGMNLPDNKKKKYFPGKRKWEQ